MEEEKIIKHTKAHSLVVDFGCDLIHGGLNGRQDGDHHQGDHK